MPRSPALLRSFMVTFELYVGLEATFVIGGVGLCPGYIIWRAIVVVAKGELFIQ